MGEKLRTYNNTLGGPVEIQVEDGVIRRIRPIRLRDDDPQGWVIEAHGRNLLRPESHGDGAGSPG